MKRLAVSPTGAHQLDDLAGTSPALGSGLSGIADMQSLSHIATLAGIESADHNREVPVSAEMGHDLVMQTTLDLFDRQEQVGALLCGELKNTGEVCSASAWINAPSGFNVLRSVSVPRAHESR
jgi:hypothetical protein